MQLLDRDLPDEELKSNVDRFLWLDLNLLPAEDRRRTIDRPPDVLVHLGVDITLISHHSFTVILEDRIINFSVRCGHGASQERGRFLVEKM